MTTTYTARYERDEDGFWIVELVEEPRVHSFGKSVDEARAMIRDATALWFEVPADSFEITDLGV